MKDTVNASRARQFVAVLQKNFILQTRGRRSFLGVGGWAALLLQVLLPALFFTLMCIPKYYIQPYQHPIFLQLNEYDIDTKWWAGASPYKGPASADGKARIAFVPDTPEVTSLVQRLAMAVSCPSEPYKRICSSASITSFACMFGVQQAPAADCQNATVCMTTSACYQPALDSHLQLLPDEAAVDQWLEEHPHTLDAVVVFPRALAAREAAQDSQAAAQAAGAKATAPVAMLAHTEAGAAPAGAAAAAADGSQRAPKLQKQLVGCGAPGPPDGDGLLLDYVIRMNSSDVPPTQLLQDLFDVSPGMMPLPGNLLWEYRKYWFFVNLQLSIDRALLGGQQSASSYPAPLNIKVKPFPWPSRQEDLGAASAAAFFNLLLVYAFMAPTRAVVGSIVREKELRLREGMRILGLSEAAYWTSWSVTHWLTLAASGLLCALVGLYPFRHSSFALMLAFYWLFSAALISFSYFLSTLFSASRVAGTATQFIYALSMIPGFLLPFVRPYGGLSWYLAGLSPTSAASLFAAALVNWERLAAGVTLNTMWLPVTPDSSFCVGSVMWLLAVDVLLYAVLTWYCDKVIPQPQGQNLPPWFPFMPSYWRSGGASSKDTGGGTASGGPEGAADGIKQQRSSHKQQSQPAARGSSVTVSGSDCTGGVAPYIQILGLRKVFRSSDGSLRVAVEGLSLSMSAGRITALLGHNGAGKTTTIHMLTGMLQPTSGTALIGGCDIRTSMHTIRQRLGICPQFDILWPDITVEEHLKLYAVIKGAPWTEARSQAQAAAAEVGLLDKMGSLASDLSGGQRRKLSVAIAFMGQPAVVFLDEPTSGMDPYSRRATWEVIRNRRSKSVIVLTTHSMEEADLLCDDIHIMAEGRLAASGSSLSLKARYGVGYTLTVVLDKQLQQQVQRSAARLQHGLGSNGSLATASGSPAAASPGSQQHSSEEAIMQLLSSHVPSAQLLSAAGAEVSIRLPKDEAAAFPAALKALDAKADSLGVASYGLSVTTLEEVFLAIADQAVAMHGAVPQQPTTTATASSSTALLNSSRASSTAKLAAAAGSEVDGRSVNGAAGQPATLAATSTAASTAGVADGIVLTGAALYWQQFRALFTKRMLCARRDRLAVITQLLVPLLLVLLAMVVSTLDTQRPQQPPLLLSRTNCLMGKSALLAAAPAVRQQKEVQGFMDGYPRGDITETGYTHLYHGSTGPPLNLTLEGQLLSQWSNGAPHFDALYLQSMPPVEQLLTSLSGSGPSITLLVNQSAVSGLPAALNQATSALLRLIVAAGGAKSRPMPAAATPLQTQVLERGNSGGRANARQQLVRTDNSTSYLSRTSSYADPNLSSYSSTAAGAAVTGAAALADAGSDAGSGNAGAAAGGGHLPSCHPVIRTSSSPLPLVQGEEALRVRQDAGALMLVLCMTLAASVLSASFVVFLVREADNNSKHLQLVSGAPPTAYWLANFCWDWINFCIPASGIVLLVYWYHQPQLSGIRLVAMALLLLVFGAAGINLTYLCHYAFQDEMKALQRLNTAYFLVGYLGFLTTWVLGLIAAIMSKPAVGAVADRTKAVLRLASPHYCFAQGLYDISNTAPGAGVVPIPGLPHGPTNPFSYPVLGSAVLHLLAQAALFGAAAVLRDVGPMQLLRPAWNRLRTAVGSWRAAGRGYSGGAAVLPGSESESGGGAPIPYTALSAAEEGAVGLRGGSTASCRPPHGDVFSADADVEAERCEVEAARGQDRDQAMVVLDGISKAYPQGFGLPSITALSGLWLRIWPGECFGLLGVNGAGKTTTFKILTGELQPDTGDAYVAHHSVLTQLAAARQRLGYCPQHSALPAAMTGREVLTMYARLRGMHGPDRVRVEVNGLLQQLGLTEYADVACGAYSGGNKRKLSVAVALVGGPPLVLLDEPSTGMDPSARRFLWRVLQSAVLGAGRTILLTSHSMEEVEALASRLAIMAAGAARCLGTPQHLKSKYGDGYTLELRLGQQQPQPPPAETAAAAAAAAAQPAGDERSIGVAGQAEQENSSSSIPALQDAQAATASMSAATEAAEHYFQSVIAGAVVLEKEPGRLLLRLPLGSSSGLGGGGAGGRVVSSLADVFEAVEAARGTLGITEYSLAQSSLERVFLSLAKVASHVADGD